MSPLDGSRSESSDARRDDAPTASPDGQAPVSPAGSDAALVTPRPASSPPGTLNATRSPDPAPTRGSDLSTASEGPADGLTTSPVENDFAEPSYGDLRIMEMLGQGGMGVVYRAFDPRRGAVVALKTLGADARLSVSRFKREFRSLADAVHPNLVRLYELAADGPRWYFTMELVEGVDFLQHVRPRSDAATDYLKLRAALRQLAEGVSALHARRILHRDLKPSNVKVASDGRVVLLDFGLAAEIGPDDEHLSSTPHFCGTMAYMPPEQAACLPLTPACDWYALGVMLYEALTGRLPYSGSLTTVLRLKQDTDPPSPSSIAADVPGDLETLCLDLMRRDPSERPGGREVLDRLGAANPPAAFAPRDTAFVGREETLQVLRRAFRDARSGRTTAVLVHGASGMGKSTLVAKFLGEAGADPRAVVLAGRCYESESVPFKTIDGIVDALAAFLRRLPRGEADAFLPRDASVLARVFPVFREVAVMAESAARSGETLAPHELRQRAFDAFRELLGRIGDRRPLVVALDDLQWGDADGAARLAELFRPADRPTCLLVLAYRREDVERSECLQTLQREWPPGVPRLDAPIDALTREEIASLAAATLNSLDPVGDERTRLRLDELAAESQGSPFFVRELIARGAVRRSDERGASLDDVLGARIGLLPEAAQRLLETIAVAGAPIRRSDAYLAASLAAEDVSAEQLRSERLLRGAPSSDGEPRLETYHDRVRETILARLAPAALRDHHQRLAAALSRDGRGDPHALARHYEGAGEARLAAEYFARAAESAAEKLAFDHAAGLYQRAIELQPERAAAWWAPLAETLSFAGRGRESGEAFERAAQFAPPREALALQQKAAAQYLGAGRLDDGVALLQKMLGALGVRLPNSQFEAIVRILALRVRLAWRGLGVKTPAGGIDARAREEIEEQFQIIGALTVADPLRGQCLQSQVLLSCLERGDPVGSARAIAYQTLQFALASRRPGRAEKAYFARARELAAEVKRPEVDATVTLCEGVAAYLHGSWGVAADRCTQAGAMLEACSSRFRWDREVTRIWELNALYFLGDFRLLAERLKPVMSSAAARNDLHSLVNHGTFTQAMLMIADDRADEAVQSIDDLLARWSQSGFHVPHYNGLLMQAHAALYNGDLVAARERTDRCLRGAKSARMDWLQIIRVTLDGFAARVALAEVQAGADRRTLREVDATARRLAREGVRWSHATSLGLRAGAAHLRGDRDGATRLLREAEAEFQAAEMDLHAACCRRQWARLVGGEEGRAALAEPDALLRRQLVKEPARFAELVATGFATV